ncbi:MAG: HDOD domain-containing protein [Nitrosomonas sp.]|nr:HDOD domain-containing protein [Nitrosomonas sp.]MDP1950954.1 HDOD domain-containing protein [Nitrosomonas sp.]
MTTLISTFEKGKADFFALLSKRMGEKGDFPALSKSAGLLDESMYAENSKISDITSAILSDFTLTQKVIRLANSAMYSGMGGEITTITHAAVVLGIDAISNLALSIRFVDTLSSSAPDSEDARVELAKAILAGDIARNIVVKSNMRNGEEAVVCALMHHLGRLLLVFYFPDQWSEIRKISAGDKSLENDAALEVIGVTIDEISQEIAKTWRLPKKISDSMASLVSLNESSIPGSPEWLKIMANFAGEAASLIVKKSSKDELQKFTSRYGEALLVSSEDITESIDLALNMAQEYTVQAEAEKPQGKPGDSWERLAVGVHEVSKALAQGMDFSSALSLILETIYAGMGFNRVVTFFRDAERFRARVGFGSRMPEVLPQLVFPEAYVADVFHLSLANKADVFIQDVTSSKVASSVPVWFNEALPDVGAFILLPLVFNGRAVGLIYADWEIGATGSVESCELASMGALRDHLMKALVKRK